MTEIVQILSKMSSFRKRSPATIEQIRKAEKLLDLQFSKEYRQYLMVFGAVSILGHELTGICSSMRLDVVSVTKEQREQLDNVDASWYVIEEAHIDGIVIWQSADGSIYATAPNSKARKIANSLSEYVSK